MPPPRAISLSIQEIDLLTAADRRAHRHFLETQFRDVDAPSWTFGVVRKINGRRVAESAAAFAVAPGAYVCFHLDTATRGSGAGAGAKGREIIRGVWDAYYGDLRSLDVIGYWIVQNDDVRAAMESATRALRWGQAVDNNNSIFNAWNSVYPGQVGWEEARTNNPFIIGVDKMLAEDPAAAANASTGMGPHECR